MKLVHTRAELAAARRGLPGPVVLVPTMGALHEGHRALIRRAREVGDSVVVSIFVNPLQFGDSSDLARYPRTLSTDLVACEEEKADLVWAPAVEDIYPGGDPLVRVDPGPAGSLLEGAARPGHYSGMLTVVAKLFGAVRPDIACFGEKDAQQISLVRRMVLDLDLGVDIEEVATVRERDGLALSSRNRFLSPLEREASLVLSRAVRSGSLAEARQLLDCAPGIELSYVEQVDPLTFVPNNGPTGRLVVAAVVGGTRLIDTALLPATV